MGMFKVYSESGANPNPRNFKIMNFEQVGIYCVLLIKYPECTNYEGNKILVWRGTAESVHKQTELDPHFNALDDRLIARFRPNAWHLAKKFAQEINCE